MKKILALSSSRVGNSGFLEAALPQVRSFLGAQAMKLSFVPFASVERDEEAYGDMVREALKDLGHTVEVVKEQGGRETLLQNDAVLVGGGNTFKLLHDIYACELFDVIRTKVLNGMPYIGWSAGANLTGATIRTTNDMPIIQPLSFTAFGFLPFQINPHYINQKLDGHNGETRDQRLSEFIRLNPSVPVVGLPEGTALRLQDEVLKLEGIAPAVLFEMSGEGNIRRTELPPGSDLTHLL